MHTSPMHPPVCPRNRSSASSAGSFPADMEASGVAAVRPSSTALVGLENTAGCTPERIHVFMNSGQLNRKARAASAGLTMFCPMPPKSCLTSTMANSAPRITTQYGMVGGQTKASRMPVTTAERSAQAFSFFMILRYAHSKNTQAATLTMTTVRQRQPKYQIAAISAGTSARHTSNISRRVELGECTCGEDEIVKVPGMNFICSQPPFPALPHRAAGVWPCGSSAPAESRRGSRRRSSRIRCSP